MNIKIVIGILILSVLVLGCSQITDAPEKKGVIFKVIDGTNEYTNIKVKGSFDADWGILHPMEKDGNEWTVMIEDIPEGTYEWGAIEDDGTEWGVWLIDGPNPTVVVDANGEGSATYEIPEPSATVNITLAVDMSAETVAAEGVHVAGSFQGWNPSGTQMLDDDNDGIYTVTADMEVGTQVQFKFLNGNTWGTGIQEEVPAEHGVDDDNGGYNREITVPEAEATFTFIFSGAPVE